MRLDGGFAAPELFEFLDEVGVDYVVAMAKNDGAGAPGRPGHDRRPRASARPRGETDHVYTECRYAAGSLEPRASGGIKAEVSVLEGASRKD